jgi:hypothetical protein
MPVIKGKSGAPRKRVAGETSKGATPKKKGSTKPISKPAVKVLTGKSVPPKTQPKDYEKQNPLQTSPHVNTRTAPKTKVAVKKTDVMRQRQLQNERAKRLNGQLNGEPGPQPSPHVVNIKKKSAPSGTATNVSKKKPPMNRPQFPSDNSKVNRSSKM